MAEFLPESPFGYNSEGSTAPSVTNSGQEQQKLLVMKSIRALVYPEKRELALQLLVKNKAVEDLPCLLWHSFGIIAVLLQEILALYPIISTPFLTEHTSNRACNVLSLLQCVAAHPDTRKLLIRAKIPTYLYPFLNTLRQDRAHEYLRVNSLGVIGALVKNDDGEAVRFLLSSELLPRLIRSMETGRELSKTVASFIMNKVLSREEGLRYSCKFAERFYTIGRVLAKTVEFLTVSPSSRLLKNVVSCYLRLSENPRCRASHVFRHYFPRKLLDDSFIELIREDPTIKSSLQQLIYKLARRNGPSVESLGNSFGLMFI